MDTIELLERIGRDASLRCASGDDLVQALHDMGASDGLKLAGQLGDEPQLRQELGSRLKQVMRVNENPINGGCDPDEGDGPDEDAPDNGDGDEDAQAQRYA